MTSLKEKAKQWIAWDPNVKTREVIQKILADESKLEPYFNDRIAFGTAGLRSAMDAGPKNMNDLVIVQTTQGICKYLFEQFGEEKAKSQGVTIAFDHRKNEKLDLSSKKFALISSLIFLEHGIKVYLFDDIIATPFVPYSVTYNKCVAGIMITASHNPKQDNGFKLYWENGCQIIPPLDGEIAKAILNNLKPTLKEWPQSFDMAVLSKYGSQVSLLSTSNSEVVESYFESVKEKLCFHPEENAASKLKIMYSAMHGVGEKFATRSLLNFGFNKKQIFYVESQKKPDHEFPTVAFPNPEEKKSLDEAKKAADKSGCKLIIANDPDADRLAVCEKTEEGVWHTFSGNEIGALFACWQLRKFRESEAKRQKKLTPCIVVSTVSSKQVKEICKVEGIEYHETLTGFKYLGNKCVALKATGEKQILLAYEEAIGFCLGDNVLDKDGVSAAAVLYELANFLERETSSLYKNLKEINEKYGYFIANNGYVIITQASQKDKLLEKLKNLKNGDKFGQDKFEVTGVLEKFPNSGLINLVINKNIDVCFRMSGTEPKLKYYSEISGTSATEIKAILEEFVKVGLQEDLLKL